MLDSTRLPEGYMTTTLAFAATLSGKANNLKEKLDYLAGYGTAGDPNHPDGQLYRCTLFKDFAPHSFEFVIEKRRDLNSDWVRWFNGGLFYHGVHDGGGDGSGPTFSVNLNPVFGWSIHT